MEEDFIHSSYFILPSITIGAGEWEKMSSLISLQFRGSLVSTKSSVFGMTNGFNFSIQLQFPSKLSTQAFQNNWEEKILGTLI
jgi:hypothetical protein